MEWAHSTSKRNKVVNSNLPAINRWAILTQPLRGKKDGGRLGAHLNINDGSLTVAARIAGPGPLPHGRELGWRWTVAPALSVQAFATAWTVQAVVALLGCHPPSLAGL